MAEPRELSQAHLNAFVSGVQKGYPVTYVEGSGILAVDDPALGYITLALLDKIVDTNK